MEEAESHHDGFTARYLLWVIPVFVLWYFALELDRIFHLYIMLVPVLLLPTIAVGVAFVVSLVLNGTRGWWRTVASILAAPIVAVSIFSMLMHAGINSHWIRFHLWNTYYLEQASALSGCNGLCFKLFDWGSTGGAAVPNIHFALIYDQSDEIAKPDHERSQAWHRRIGDGRGSQMYSILQAIDDTHQVVVEKMENHFYLVTEIFQ
jgi:hypothetical protein